MDLRPLTTEELSGLDSGIRRTVLFLRSKGFETIDSGDGKSKLGKGYVDDEFIPLPHVFMVIRPKDMISASDYLVDVLTLSGVEIGPIGDEPHIQATYDPFHASSIIELYRVDDNLLFGGRKEE